MNPKKNRTIEVVNVNDSDNNNKMKTHKNIEEPKQIKKKEKKDKVAEPTRVRRNEKKKTKTARRGGNLNLVRRMSRWEDTTATRGFKEREGEKKKGK